MTCEAFIKVNQAVVDEDLDDRDSFYLERKLKRIINQAASITMTAGEAQNMMQPPDGVEANLWVTTKVVY